MYTPKIMLIPDYVEEIELLTKENQELKKQLNYLRNGEYYNQLRFERDMLEHIVEHRGVSKEDKAFIDMTHRNTELLEQQKEFIKYLQEELNVQIQEESIGCETTNKRYILEEILQKYKEIIGDDK